MSTRLLQIGRFGLVVPDNLMYKVATLEIDLRPAVITLQKESKKLEPKPYVYKPRVKHVAKKTKHIHQFKKYYSRYRCIDCGLKRRKLPDEVAA